MQTSFVWPSGARCALSLTYDDGLPVHYASVGPQLVEHGLRGTFFVPVLSDIHAHPEQWRALSDAGHELGNHTVFHPCRREPPESYSWLDAAYDLSNYTPQRFAAELDVADLVLRLVDGKTQRSYGNTCCDTTLGRGAEQQPLDPILSERFVAARGAQSDRVAVVDDTLNLMDVGCFGVDYWPLHRLSAMVDSAVDAGGWAVLMIHGVGSESHSMFLDTDVHSRFLEQLAQRRSTVWTAPFIEVASYIRTWRERQGTAS